MADLHFEIEEAFKRDGIQTANSRIHRVIDRGISLPVRLREKGKREWEGCVAPVRIVVIILGTRADVGGSL